MLVTETIKETFRNFGEFVSIFLNSHFGLDVSMCLKATVFWKLCGTIVPIQGIYTDFGDIMQAWHTGASPLANELQPLVI